MFRTLRQPRWLLLLAVLVVVVVVFARLGQWQLDAAANRAATEQLQAQAAQPRVPVEQVVGPHETFPADAAGRPVSATGSYRADLQFLVPQRVLDGVQGYWVVTPLELADGGLLPVLRGFVADPGQADRPGPQQVSVEGTLAPGEAPSEDAEVPEGQRGSIDLAALANVWPGQLYNTFVFAQQERPQVTGPAVTPVPSPSFLDGSVDWRNLGYALQWWVFAAFAVLMYVRFLSEASRRHTDDRARRPHERTTPHHV